METSKTAGRWNAKKRFENLDSIQKTFAQKRQSKIDRIFPPVKIDRKTTTVKTKLILRS